MKSCVFCKIAEGKMKSFDVYESDYTKCFLDINPLSKGHCLLITKKHFIDIFDIDKKYLYDILDSIKIVTELQRKKLGADGINILHASGKSAQQSVFHFHIHLVPRYKNDYMDAWPRSNYKGKNIELVAKKMKT